MKHRLFRALVVSLSICAIAGYAAAQSDPGSGQKTLAATMDVFVFPTEGQDASQQSKDEADCYTWAVQNAGTDPFQLQKQSEQQAAEAEAAKQEVQSAGQGAGAAGAVKGAAVGALIGEIASDDPGKGAAYGAAAGLIAGRRQRARAQHQATEQIEQQSQQAQAATAEEMLNFKKAFSVCLEAKDYLVKY